MINSNIIFTLFVTAVTTLGCQLPTNNESDAKPKQALNLEQEKQAIIATLNNETKAAFQRDYEGWKENWVQDPTITKSYLNFSEDSFSESIGWKEISSFVRTYIEEHPEPEPLPEPLAEINVRLYGTGAWVTYEQQGAKGGVKRESRLMEKIDGQWKIAGMQTSIYRSKSKE